MSIDVEAYAWREPTAEERSHLPGVTNVQVLVQTAMHNPDLPASLTGTLWTFDTYTEMGPELYASVLRHERTADDIKRGIVDSFMETGFVNAVYFIDGFRCIVAFKSEIGAQILDTVKKIVRSSVVDELNHHDKPLRCSSPLSAGMPALEPHSERRTSYGRSFDRWFERVEGFFSSDGGNQSHGTP